MPSSITDPETQAATHFASRSVRAIPVSIDTGSLAGACAATTPDGPRDVGNMAYPQPLPQGNLSTTPVAGRHACKTFDTAYPDPKPAGVIDHMGATWQALRNGNMDCLTPLSAGSVPVIVLK